MVLTRSASAHPIGKRGVRVIQCIIQKIHRCCHNRCLGSAGRLAALAVGVVLLVGAAAGGEKQGNSTPAADRRAEIQRLIEQLGDPDFTARDRAQEQLAKIGQEAFDALTVAANDSDLEIASRARYLLRKIDVPAVRDGDSDRVRTILADYRSVSSGERLRKVQLLLLLPQGEGYAAACRLCHIEKSPLLARFAALEVINRWPVHAEGRRRMKQAIDGELRLSGQPSAEWLRCYRQLDDDPAGRLDAWRRLTDAEAALLAQFPARSDPRLVASLLFHLACWESQAGRPAAEEHFKEGQKRVAALAEETIEFHLDMANFFRQRGKVDWAVEEYGIVRAMGYDEYVPFAQIGLAETLHDAGRDREAADALDVILQLAKKQKLQSLDLLESSPEKIAARMHYMRACEESQKGNSQQHRFHLDEALKNDPEELDALIAAYRLTDLGEDHRQKTAAMIERAAAALRLQVEQTPDDPSAHNQFAWLVGNTTGDMSEALRHAQRAVELGPENGAYLDTLAHVYFYGLNDYPNAVKYQSLAAKYMPYSGLIAQKLEVFRKKAQPPGGNDAERGL